MVKASILLLFYLTTNFFTRNIVKTKHVTIILETTTYYKYININIKLLIYIDKTKMEGGITIMCVCIIINLCNDEKDLMINTENL